MNEFKETKGIKNFVLMLDLDKAIDDIRAEAKELRSIVEKGKELMEEQKESDYA